MELTTKDKIQGGIILLLAISIIFYINSKNNKLIKIIESLAERIDNLEEFLSQQQIAKPTEVKNVETKTVELQTPIDMLKLSKKKRKGKAIENIQEKLF